jgi:hypothetical protein
VEPSETDAAKCAAVLRGDAAATAAALLPALRSAAGGALPTPGAAGWARALAEKAAGAREKLAARLSRTVFPLDYHTTLRVVRDELARLPQPPIVVAEGANTMDQARWVCVCVFVFGWGGVGEACERGEG